MEDVSNSASDILSLLEQISQLESYEERIVLIDKVDFLIRDHVSNFSVSEICTIKESLSGLIGSIKVYNKDIVDRLNEIYALSEAIDAYNEHIF